MGLLKVCLLVLLISFEANGFKFAISHWNDVSGQLERYKKGTSLTSAAPTPCPGGEEVSCIGGLVNMVHWIHDNSSFGGIPEENMLRISSGNLIGGESGWLSSLENGWKKFGELAKYYYMPHAMALGMKEFGAGVKQTMDIFNTSDIVNITLSNACMGGGYSGIEAQFCSKVPKISILELTADNTKHKIGVIGFVTPTVEVKPKDARLSLPGKLKFAPIVDSIKSVVSQNSGQIKTFIAIGDGNLDTAKQILDNVREVKLVIYGMGFGNSKNMQDEYPMKYKHGFIATAGRYGSTIGKLVLDLNPSTGELSSVFGKLVETSYPQPIEGITQAALNEYDRMLLDEITPEKTNYVGHTRVTLQGGEICWRQECNLGNLVTDAMVHCAINDAVKPFPYPLHAIWHGGAIFEDDVKAGASIYKFDIHKWLPYHNLAHLVRVNGSNLWKVFQASATGINPEKAGAKDWRQFLQVSNGMEVYFDTLNGPPTLKRIRMVHDDNGVPGLSDLINENFYYLIIPTYLYEGRGVYEFAGVNGFWDDAFLNSTTSTSSTIDFDDDCVENYIRAMKHVTVGFEERIWINDDRQAKECHKGQNTAVTVILTIVFFTIFLAITYVGYFYVIPRLRRPNVEYPPNQL